MGRNPLFFLQQDVGGVDDIVRRVWQALEPHLGEHGYELIEVEYGREGRGAALRLFIDRTPEASARGGIALDDCAAVSRLASPLLDAADFIQGAYTLEVSSPGFDRPLRRPKDFLRFIGEPVRVTVHAPVAGRKRVAGILRGCADGLVTVECDGTCHEVHIENVKKARLDR